MYIDAVRLEPWDSGIAHWRGCVDEDGRILGSIPSHVECPLREWTPRISQLLPLQHVLDLRDSVDRIANRPGSKNMSGHVITVWLKYLSYLSSATVCIVSMHHVDNSPGYVIHIEYGWICVQTCPMKLIAVLKQIITAIEWTLCPL